MYYINYSNEKTNLQWVSLQANYKSFEQALFALITLSFQNPENVYKISSTDF